MGSFGFVLIMFLYYHKVTRDPPYYRGPFLLLQFFQHFFFQAEVTACRVAVLLILAPKLPR
jgi:hypothetical protein